MKKTLKITSFVVLVLFCFSNLMAASALTIVDNKSKEVRLQNIFQYQLDEMVSQEKQTMAVKSVTAPTISKIKKLKDFDANQYLLVELEPEGYMIYHIESGNFVEHSVSSVSPYCGFDQDIYYAGPNEYYYLNHSTNQYEHTIFNDYIANENLEHNRQVCSNIERTLESNKDQQTLDYIDKNIPIARPMGTEASNGFYYINGYTFFSKLDQCGYMSGGVCGYIALGMLLAYHRALSGRNSCPADCVKYTKSGSTFSYSWIHYNLASRLVEIGKSLGIGNSTYPWNMNDIANKYLIGDRGYKSADIEHFSGTTNQMIAHHLKKDRPIIWFGEIISNSHNNQKFDDHAIVIYAYKPGVSYSYIAHFGWNGAKAVTFSGILGGYYSNYLTK